MLRAATWDLGRKQQTLRLLTRSLSLELRSTISTSKSRDAAAQQYAPSSRDEEASDVQHASRSEPSRTEPDPRQQRRPGGTSLREASKRSAIPDITSEQPTRGPVWDVTSPTARGIPRNKLTTRQYRARKMIRKSMKVRELNNFHEHVQQKKAEAPRWELSSNASAQLEQHGNHVDTPTEDFVDKFATRRHDNSISRKPEADYLHDEFAGNFGARREDYIGELAAEVVDDKLTTRRHDGLEAQESNHNSPDNSVLENLAPRQPVLDHQQDTANSLEQAVARRFAARHGDISKQDTKNGPPNDEIPGEFDAIRHEDVQMRQSQEATAAEDVFVAQRAYDPEQREPTGDSPRGSRSGKFNRPRHTGVELHEAEVPFTDIFNKIFEGRYPSSREEPGHHESSGDPQEDDFSHKSTTSQGIDADQRDLRSHATAAFNQMFEATPLPSREEHSQPESIDDHTLQSEPYGKSTTTRHEVVDPLDSNSTVTGVFHTIFGGETSSGHDETMPHHVRSGDFNGRDGHTGSFEDQLDEILNRFDHEASGPRQGMMQDATNLRADDPLGNEPRHADDPDFSITTATRDPATGLSRSWLGHGPSWWIHRCASGYRDQHLWRTSAAKLRTVRPPIIALQLLIRREALRLEPTDERRSVLQDLPQGLPRRSMIEKMAALGITRKTLNSIGDVIAVKCDEERCRRFLSMDGPKPIWLLNFLLRPQSSIQDPKTLGALIEYCTATFCRNWSAAPSEVSRTKLASETIAPEDMAHLILLLAMRAMALETRLLPQIAQLAAQYIEKMGSADWHSSKVFYDQCELFNAALAAFRPSKLRLPSTWYRWLPPHWEAQKILLNMSTNLPKQLLVDHLGYKAVREVLGSLDKDQNEMHNSLRHRESWPPYLDPSDGIDEATDPEANWSRAVSAGTLQQEAGYSSDRTDDVLDILQGRAPDSTPTIKQRIINTPHANASLWEASIRATRNVQEAWDRFRTPPAPGLEPGVHEYGAMLTKLLSHAASDDSMELPGDRALNFKMKEDPNLTEFEKTRRRPPTVTLLCQSMLQRGIKLTGAVLVRLLASNHFKPGRKMWSPTQMSHARTRLIFKLSSLEADQYQPLLDSEIAGSKAMREVPLPLFAAYIQHLASFRPVAPELLLRAMRFCEARFTDDQEAQPWAQHCWGMLLKASARRPADPRFLTRGLVPQIDSFHHVVDAIAAKCFLRLPTVIHLARSTEKASRRILSEFYEDAGIEHKFASGPLIALYGRENQRATMEERLAGVDPEFVPMMQSLHQLTARLTTMVKGLIDREAKVRSLLSASWTESVDEMRARCDPVKARDANQLMWTWAFAGEYETMAWYLEWLVEQWDSSKLQEELQNVLTVPPFADFGNALAIFQRFAEPMLPADRVEKLRQKIDNANVVWKWPSQGEVDDRLRRDNIPSARLQYVQTWTQYWHAKERNEDVSVMATPKHWMEFSVPRVSPDREEEDEEAPQNWDGSTWPSDGLWTPQ